jgi:DNA-binding NtrC family response regulator
VSRNHDVRKTLLIVDDEPDLVEVLQTVLGGVATEIRTASNGREALQIVREGGIDAIISDVNMPLMNGLQFLAEVRHLSMETPFVIISAFGDKANLLEALRLDATDFIDKPFSRDQVRKVVSQALEVGVALRNIQGELDLIFQSSSLPGDQLMRVRSAKQALMMLKAKSSIYFKKSA